jgi:hypothetical protein
MSDAYLMICDSTGIFYQNGGNVASGSWDTGGLVGGDVYSGFVSQSTLEQASNLSANQRSYWGFWWEG